jgi:uncharacterized protein
MKCPVCIEPDLVMTHRENIEIDYCPRCRGVWLDRGELDKIIEQNKATASPKNVSQSDYRRDHDDDDRYQEQPKKKKRESFLGELFDF